MADLGRLKKSRTAHKNVLQGLIVKAQNCMKEGPGEGTVEDVSAFVRTIKTKVNVITELNENLDVIDEVNIDGDIEETTHFERKIEKNVAEIEKYMKKKIHAVEKNEITNSASSIHKTVVKLPKIIIKKFSGIRFYGGNSKRLSRQP